MIKKVLALVTCLLLVFSLVPISAFAVTGNHIAADGTYTSKLQGYKKGEAKSDYTATLNVVVKNGKFSSLYVTNYSKDKMLTAFNASGYEKFLNNDACVTVVEAVDAVSSATTGTRPDKNKKYSINLVDAMISALNKAPDSGNTSSGDVESPESDEVLVAPLYGYKEGELKYTATLNLGIKDDKIQNIWLSDYSSDKMQESLSAANYSQFLGIDATVAAVKSVSDLDAVSGATKIGLNGDKNAKYSISLVDSLIIALKRSDVYTASVKGQKVKSGRVKETYTATLNAVVDDGKILGIWLTDYKDDKIVKKVFANTGYTAFIDIEATEAAVNAAAKTSAVKNAEAGAELTTSKEYSMNLVQGMLEIVGQVPVPAPETFLTGSASADNNKYQLTVTVGMRDGKISSLSAQDVNANANWSSVVSAALDKLLGKTATEAETLSVDAISSATRYSATFYSAVCNALGTQSTDLSKTLASEPTFVWSDDLSSATVNVSYKNGDTAQYNAEVTRQVKTEATCSAEGSATYTATAHIDTVDGIQVFTSTRTSVLAKLAHSPAEAVRENVTEATCTEDGAYDEVIRCEICGELLGSTHHTVAALGHAWGEPEFRWNGTESVYAVFTCANDDTHQETVSCTLDVETTAATCTETGAQVFTPTASFAGNSYTDFKTVVLEKLAHSPAEAVRENVTEATCTEDGAYDEVIRCEICGELLESTHHAVEALGHRWGEWTVVKEPTYDEEGLQQRVCENDAAHVETETIARLARTDLSAAVVVLSETKLIYDGTPQSVTASVTLDGLTLVEGTDYTLTGNTQTESGVYTATVHGIGAYCQRALENYENLHGDFLRQRKNQNQPTRGNDFRNRTGCGCRREEVLSLGG